MESEGNTWYFGKLPLVTVVSEIPFSFFWFSNNVQSSQQEQSGLPETLEIRIT